MAFADLMHSYDYVLLGIPYGNNLVWANKHIVKTLQNTSNNEDMVACAYRDGYYYHHMMPNNTGIKYHWNRDVDFFLYNRGTLEERAQIMRTTLINKSYQRCLSRQNQRHSSVCDARRKAINTAAIQWPSAPLHANPDFLSACNRIAHQPRVQLLATADAVSKVLALRSNKVPLAGTSYHLRCDSLASDFYVVPSLPRIPSSLSSSSL
mmetsp:Transcript_18846/g.28437  ORF Transcript_18846/g.28437 Transcript_18846/m.28437 type:complete len:208 (-) Transcript_18846:72-695(-)